MAKNDILVFLVAAHQDEQAALGGLLGYPTEHLQVGEPSQLGSPHQLRRVDWQVLEH